MASDHVNLKARALKFPLPHISRSVHHWMCMQLSCMWWNELTRARRIMNPLEPEFNSFTKISALASAYQSTEAHAF